MFLNFALFYAAVAVFYFAVQFLRSYFQRRAEYTPPPTMDVVFIVKVLMGNGRWGIMLQKHRHYYRLPMLVGMDRGMDFGRNVCLSQDFVGDNGRYTRLVLLCVSDVLLLPYAMPRMGVAPVDAECVIDMVMHMRGEFSITSHGHMMRIQQQLVSETGMGNFAWFQSRI